jgi:hypothetical protein
VADSILGCACVNELAHASSGRHWIQVGLHIELGPANVVVVMSGVVVVTALLAVESFDDVDKNTAAPAKVAPKRMARNKPARTRLTKSPPSQCTQV